MNGTRRLHDAGQSIWLDNITRGLLGSGGLRRYINELSVTGLTSNPTIFDHAIRSGRDYDAGIREKLAVGLAGERLFFELALEDLTQAADLFRPIHEATNRIDGWVSLELPPTLAYDTKGSVAAAKELHARARRQNLFIKIPGTREGGPAIEEAIFAGVPVNVTLLFSPEQYLVAGGRLHAGARAARGRRAQRARAVGRLALREPLGRRGGRPRAARSARPARYRDGEADVQGLPRTPRLGSLAPAAEPRRALAAPPLGQHRDEGPDGVRCTLRRLPRRPAHREYYVPEKTLPALADHGEIAAMLPHDGGDAEEVLDGFRRAGIDLDKLAATLQADGAGAFVKSWEDLLACIGEKSETLRRAG